MYAVSFSHILIAVAVMVYFLHDFICMALCSLYCTEVPLRNCSLTHLVAVMIMVCGLGPSVTGYVCSFDLNLRASEFL